MGAPPKLPPNATVPAAPPPAGAAHQAPPPSPAAPLSWPDHLRFNRKAFLTGGLMVALLLAGAWYYFSGHVTTDDAQVDCHITAMAPQVPGYVVKLLIDDNTAVRQGDVLVQIDPREYQAEVEQAQANLEVAEAQVRSAQLQIGLTQQTTSYSTGGASAQKESDEADYASAQKQLEQTATANLLQAQANVMARQATNERTQADLERYKPLLATGDVSKFQFDAVDAAARVAKSELEAAQQQLAAAQQNVEIARANTRSSQAKLARSQSAFMET